MEKAFQIHLDQNLSFLKGSKLLVAISGGIDSTVVCHLLDTLNYPFSLAHCNFKLRGLDSDLDADFIKELSKKINKPLHITEFNTEAYSKKNRISIQMAARDLRYKWFHDLMKKHAYDYLITAHHADDNLETFLINLSRGTGLDGLTGIPEKENNIIRPLLPFNRNEIEAYAVNNNIDWREDKSNDDTKYLRNKIRKDLLPVLKQLNPNFMQAFSNTIQNLKGSSQIIDDRMKSIMDTMIEPDSQSNSEIIRFKVDKLKPISNNTAYLYRLFYPFGFNQWHDIQTLLSAQSGKMILSKTHRLIKHGGHLLLSPISDNSLSIREFEVTENQDSLNLNDLKIRFETEFINEIKSIKKYKNSLLEAAFDKDLLRFPLVVRKWQKGDYFYPNGMRGKKKLSKFFKDEKFSLLQKEKIWLLCSGKDIIWLIGKRKDQRYQVTNKTQNILIATIDI